MELKNLLYEKRDYIGIVKFNRPKQLNAIDSDTAMEIVELFDAMDKDSDIRCVILTGEGERAFSAGGDIREEAEKTVLMAYDFIKLGTKALSSVENFRAPVIAAINGYCLGAGTEFALCCDIRLAAENAKLGSPEVTLGLLPGWGGTQRLPRIIGISKAKEFIFTGDKYTAQQSYEMGLVDRIVPADALLDEAIALAEKIASRPPMAINYIKTLINDGMQCDLQRALRMEGAMAVHLFETQDNKEACAAFLEKRPHKEFIGK